MLNLDTHILIHVVQGTLTFHEEKLLRSQQWSICSMVFWEIAKLTEKRRLEIDLHHPELLRLLSHVRVWPIDRDLCLTLGKLDFKSDPADELIAASSVLYNIPLVTRDKTILKSKVVPLAKV